MALCDFCNHLCEGTCKGAKAADLGEYALAVIEAGGSVGFTRALLTIPQMRVMERMGYRVFMRGDDLSIVWVSKPIPGIVETSGV